MNEIKILAPAKINLRLDVIGKRSDGYHELRMLMVPVDLADEIVMTRVKGQGPRVKGGGEIQLTIEGADSGIAEVDTLPVDEKNIAYRTAKIVLEKAGVDTGVKILLKKRVPIGAGLGGGSSDAAAVLKGMLKLTNFTISEADLSKIAVKLGADVPFFLKSGPKIAEGVGERLISIKKLPNMAILLINPAFQVSTAWVYGNLKLTYTKPHVNFPVSYDEIEDVAQFMHNDLESVVIPMYPVVQKIKDELEKCGAVRAMMSGSGPTVFGIFENFDSRDTACKKMAATHPDWFVRAATNVG